MHDPRVVYLPESRDLAEALRPDLTELERKHIILAMEPSQQSRLQRLAEQMGWAKLSTALKGLLGPR